MPRLAPAIRDNNTTMDTDQQIIVWVALDENPLDAEKVRSSNIHWNSDTKMKGALWLDSSNVKRIHALLGDGYAFLKRPLAALQQGVMTAEILRHQYPYRIVYKDSPAAALEYLSTLDHAEKQKVLVWLDVHQHVDPETWTFAYDILTNECGSIYPPREEIVWADFKIYDMQAFDRMAAEDGAYHPLTCYPRTSNHHCCLPKGAMSVLKRSHSCGAGHVKVIAAGRKLGVAWQKLLGYDGTRKDYYRWAHQEYVPSLIDFGEFRIFIATRTGQDGMREPYVVSTIHTRWTDARYTVKACDHGKLGHEYLATKVDPQDKWSEYPSLSYEKLVGFALNVYRRLQNSGEKGFQSLTVGGRLDIGIVQDGEQFFVNELTRWYGAHHFALQTQAQPGDKICRAYAKAFAETMGKEARDEEVEQPGRSMSERDRPATTPGPVPSSARGNVVAVAKDCAGALKSNKRKRID